MPADEVDCRSARLAALTPGPTRIPLLRRLECVLAVGQRRERIISYLRPYDNTIPSSIASLLLPNPPFSPSPSSFPSLSEYKAATLKTNPPRSVFFPSPLSNSYSTCAVESKLLFAFYFAELLSGSAYPRNEMVPIFSRHGGVSALFPSPFPSRQSRLRQCHGRYSHAHQSGQCQQSELPARGRAAPHRSRSDHIQGLRVIRRQLVCGWYELRAPAEFQSALNSSSSTTASLCQRLLCRLKAAGSRMVWRIYCALIYYQLGVVHLLTDLILPFLGHTWRQCRTIRGWHGPAGISPLSN